MEHDLAVDPYDRRGTVVTGHREHLADSPPYERGIAATEEPGLDRLVAVDEEERAGIRVLEVRLHLGRAIGVQEHEAGLARDRIPKQRPQLGVGLEIDEPGWIDARVAVVRGEDDE